MFVASEQLISADCEETPKDLSHFQLEAGATIPSRFRNMSRRRPR